MPVRDPRDCPAPALEDPLRAVLHSMVGGGRLDDVDRGRLARALDRTLAEVDTLVSLVERLKDPSRTSPVRRCVGMTCRLREGAQRCEDLIACFSRAGIHRPVELVHCLDACDQGPNFQFEDFLYSEGTRRVSVEDRAWRGPAGVARPVTDGGPPVRD